MECEQFEARLDKELKRCVLEIEEIQNEIRCDGGLRASDEGPLLNEVSFLKKFLKKCIV